MTGMAKVSYAEPAEVEVNQPPLKEQVLLYDGVPLDMIHYFSMDMTSLTDVAKKQMGEIYDMLKGSDFIKKLGRMERKVGQPSGGETRYGKLWHWLKLNNRYKGDK